MSRVAEVARSAMRGSLAVVHLVVGCSMFALAIALSCPIAAWLTIRERFKK